jgi:hypothetical protein
MNRLLACASLCLCLLGAAEARANWQDDLTPSHGKFPALRPLHAHYKFGWGVLSAAEADFDYSRTPNGIGRMNLEARSTNPVRVTWRMDATHTSTIKTATLRPIEMKQTETYRDETIVTRVDFTDEGVSRLRESKPPGKKPAHVRKFEFPNINDLHSALHFIRSQRLQNGDTYKLVVYPATTPYLAEVKVASRDHTRALGRSFDSIKLDFKLWEIKKDHTLANVQRYKKASVWLSDDSDRLPLRIESEIFVGHVWAELDKVDFK